LSFTEERRMIGFLIRHGQADPVGRWLAGRRPGISLNAAGREQTAQLVRALTWAPLTAVYTSPLERAFETALPLARDHGLDVRVRHALTDIDFGAWTGRMLEELCTDPEWNRFNSDRNHACPPGGEALTEVQRRVVEELLALAKTHPGEVVAIVTHAEPIRCALAAFAGQSLNEVLAIEIEPAHVSAIGITSGVRRVLGVNVPANEVSM
jgi:broad specificity phosphatase PhoE